MSYLALYREWRPKTFDEVVEQKQAVFSLRQAVVSGQIGHAYLFSGTRGTGKTTLAKIFSRAINCLSPQNGNPCNTCEICRAILSGTLMDVIEMDAASNNSVDNIRRICDEVVFLPSQARFKVYIIDEVHMLSTGAFNALLKTLEEPPAHAVFILATTEPHRLPATILSRCQRYEFRRIAQEAITARLAEIASRDGIAIAQEALEAIAVFADGAMRDAISLLDQAKSSIAGSITRDDVLALAGITQDDFMLRLGGALLDGDAAAVLTCIDELVMSGKDLARFINDLAQFFRNLLVCQISRQPERLVQATDEGIARMSEMAASVRYQTLIKMIQLLAELISDLRWSSDARTLLEIGLIRIMAEIKPELTLEQPSGKPSAEPDDNRSAHPPEAKIDAEKDPASDEAAPLPSSNEDALLPVSDEDMPLPVSDEEAPLSDNDDEVPPPGDDDCAEAIAVGTDSSGNRTAEISGVVSTPQVEVPRTTAAEKSEEMPDQAQLWQSVLDGLQKSGEMVLFLFGKTAAVQLCDNSFHILFGPDDQVHHDEFNKDQSRKILRSLLKEACGRELALNIRIAEDPEQAAAQSCTIAEEPWIRQIRETADQFGIPVKVEE